MPQVGDTFCRCPGCGNCPDKLRLIKLARLLASGHSLVRSSSGFRFKRGARLNEPALTVESLRSAIDGEEDLR